MGGDWTACDGTGAGRSHYMAVLRVAQSLEDLSLLCTPFVRELWISHPRSPLVGAIPDGEELKTSRVQDRFPWSFDTTNFTGCLLLPASYRVPRLLCRNFAAGRMPKTTSTIAPPPARALLVKSYAGRKFTHS